MVGKIVKDRSMIIVTKYIKLNENDMNDGINYGEIGRYHTLKCKRTNWKCGSCTYASKIGINSS